MSRLQLVIFICAFLLATSSQVVESATGVTGEDATDGAQRLRAYLKGCVVGSEDGTAARPLPSPSEVNGSVAWEPSPEPNRLGATCVYDSKRRRLIEFGGWDFQVRGDVWTMGSGNSPWSRMGIDPGPALEWHFACYDSQSDKMIVLGGDDGVSINQRVWALELASKPRWVELSLAGERPPALEFSSYAFDESRQRILMFGGIGKQSTNDCYVLELSRSVWRKVSASGLSPEPRGYAAAAYDKRREGFVLFGGASVSTGIQFRNDTWTGVVGDSVVWTQISTGGPAPAPRLGHAGTIDEEEGRFVIQGGTDSAARALKDTWMLPLSGGPWQEQPGTSGAPTQHIGHALVWHPAWAQIVAVGGGTGSGFVAETWVINPGDHFAKWTLLDPSEKPPAAKRGASCGIDDRTGETILFGGDGTDSTVWTRTKGKNAVWRETPVVGPGPGPRVGQSLIYDSLGRRFLMFGGLSRAGLPQDVWELSDSPSRHWSSLPIADPQPVGRRGHSAIYDPKRDEMVVFGGLTSSGPTEEMLILSLSPVPTWREVIPIGPTPLNRSGHSAVYDGLRDRMIVFGGVTDQSTPGDAVWEFSLSTHEWTQLVIPGQSPGPHATHVAVWDAQTDQMIVFGGDGTSDVWILHMAPSPSWERVLGDGLGPSARNGCTAVWDTRLHRMVVFGGGTGDGRLSDTWYLNVASRKRADPSQTAAPRPSTRPEFQSLVLHQMQFGHGSTPVIEWSVTNPGDGRSHFRISVSESSALRLQLTDVAGRLLVDTNLGVLNAGDHNVTWSPGDLAHLANGMYLVRVLLGPWSTQDKLVFLKP